MDWNARLQNYKAVTGFPEALFVCADGRVVGTWIMGNDYRVKSTFYGGYPAGYLKRIKSLFPDKLNTLHVFSGKVDTALFPGKTVDSNVDNTPDYLDDAHTLKSVPLEEFDLVLADPPYGPLDVASLLKGVKAARVIIENDRHVDAPAGWQVTKTKRYGTTFVTMLEPDEALGGEEDQA